jgi:hypothetical protein
MTISGRCIGRFSRPRRPSNTRLPTSLPRVFCAHPGEMRGRRKTNTLAPLFMCVILVTKRSFVEMDHFESILRSRASKIFFPQPAS